MSGKATRGRKRLHLLSDLMKGKSVALKRIAVKDNKEWQKLIRAGSHFSAEYLKQNTTLEGHQQWISYIYEPY